MAHTVIEPWVHGEIVAAAKVQQYADNLTDLMENGIVRQLYPSPGPFFSSERFAMIEHWNRWLFYISESEEQPGNIRPHFGNVAPEEEFIELEYAPEGAYYDLDTIEWVVQGLIIQVNYVKCCFEVELFDVNVAF